MLAADFPLFGGSRLQAGSAQKWHFENFSSHLRAKNYLKRQVGTFPTTKQTVALATSKGKNPQPVIKPMMAIGPISMLMRLPLLSMCFPPNDDDEEEEEEDPH